MAKWLFAALFFLSVFSAAPQVHAAMTANEFTRAYAAKAEALIPGAKAMIRKELEVDIKMPQGAETEMLHSLLDNAFKKYLEAPERLDEIMDQYIRALVKDIEADAAPKREQLMPVVRHRHFMDEAKKKARSDQAYPERQLAGDIYVFYAIDMPDTVRYADKRTIADLKIGNAELDSVAIGNLRRIMAEPLIDTSAQMVAISAIDPYMTSVLLIDQFWSRDRFRFKGDLVVFVVSRDLMLVSGSGEGEGLAATRKLAETLIGQVPYAISAAPIVRRDGKWQSFAP